MKITSAKFYQAVSVFDGERYKTVTHVNLGRPEISGKIELTVKDGVGLLVETEHGATIITFNNIAFMTMEKPEKTKAPAKKA